jgi:SPP1 family predicted phage head-tail adaptor
MVRRCAGEYNRPVTVENIKSDATENAYGEVDLTADASWETYAARRAKVVTKGGREFWKVDKVEADVSAVFWLRYDSTTVDITPEMRIALGTADYQIISAVDVDNAHEEIEIQAKLAV